MVVSRAGVQGACGVALWTALMALGCASQPPQPRSADLIMPEWVSGNEPPPPSKSKETTRLVQKPGLIYGDPAQQRAPARRAKSPFLPKSANSQFFGGSGCIETATNKCH